MAKMENKKKNGKFTRLGIFVFFDSEGVVDDYVIDTLNKLNPFFSKMVVVSNGNINAEGVKKIDKVCHQLFIRKNYGLDAAAYKEAMVNFLGWDEVERYDELVLINDTFFGPVMSFKEMFNEMEQKEVDFWGLSAGYISEDGWKRVKYGYIPDHVQTFFIAFRKEMVKNGEFHKYWHEYNDSLNSFVDVVINNELILTKHFQDLGFKWGIYAKTEKYNSRFMTENYNLYYYNSHEMIKYLDFPILKRKVLELNIPEYLYMRDIEDPAESMNYIKNHTSYDETLIWDNALRRYNIKDIFDSLHLNYVFDSSSEQTRDMKDTAIVFMISDMLYVEQLSRRAQELSKYLDVYIICEDEKAEKEFRDKVSKNKRITVLETTYQKTPMGSCFIGCKELAQKYEYLGFLADCNNPMHYPTTVADSVVYSAVQNIANDINYITNVIECFSNNKKLGVLGIPFAIHHFNFKTYGNEWGEWYDMANDLVQKMHLKCNLDASKQPLTLMDAFWCRTKALLPMWNYNWTADKFYCNPVTKVSSTNEVIKRILPYVAQSEGFYSGIVMHTNYASMRLTTQQYMLDQIIGITRKNLGCSDGLYAGYIQQLNALQMNSNSVVTSPYVSTPLLIGVRGALGIYLKKHLPERLSNFLIKILRLGPLPI